MPDAARASGLTLSVSPSYDLVVRPGGNGRIQFTLRDEQNLAVPDYPIRFSLSSPDGGPSARLSSYASLTDGDGVVVVELLAGSLDGLDGPAYINVDASSEGAPTVRARVVVTTNAYSVKILPVSAEDVLASSSVASASILFLENKTCADVDLLATDITSVDQNHYRDWVPTREPVVFNGLTGQGSHAFVGLGRNNYGTVLIAGCADIAGASLRESEAVQATLVMNHLFPVPTGEYQLLSDIRFDSTGGLPALPAIQSVWQEWTRCQMDPARLWLDCTLDALSGDDPKVDPNDCVPVPGAEGALGDLLVARRGDVASKGGPSGPPALPVTPCHDATDDGGQASLEAIVSRLFGQRQTELSALRLETLPAEIGTVLSAVRLDSQLAVKQASSPNSFLVEHSLVGVTMPNDPSPSTFKVRDLGLPVVRASGIEATLKKGQLFNIPRHGFTLRLGTVARHALEKTNLRDRGVDDIGDLVEHVFQLARYNDGTRTLTACDALDASLCNELHQVRGCLLSACHSGLTALRGRLTSAFTSLDGSTLDLFIVGYASAMDLGTDRRADALGMTRLVDGLWTEPGYWRVEVVARAQSSSHNGSWTGLLMTSSP